jgi:hypothetical protein
MFEQQLQDFVAANPRLVTCRPCANYAGLSVLKYTRRVFYDGLWNHMLEHCRGTIVDADFNVVSYPFTKIYNLGVEDRAPQLDSQTPVTAYRKVNGFMASVTWYDGDILVSTTGSTDSDFTKYIRSMIDTDLYRQVCCDWPKLTFMFECVHPEDPHIIPEAPGMYLLGYRIKEWGSTVGHDPALLQQYATEFGCHAVESIETTVEQLVQLTRAVRHEGWVAYAANGQCFKIKSPYYLIKKALARKKDILSLNKEVVAEEYFPLVDHLLTMRDQFNSFNEQTRLDYIRTFLSK